MSDRRTLRLLLEYDGSAFSGWAAQPGLRTIETVVHEAFRQLFPELERIAVAGRTDAGVHASGQVISLVAVGGPPDDRIVRAANAVLPHDVAVRACDVVADDFHARFSASSRTYEYRLLRASAPSPLRATTTLHWPMPLDQAVLAACAEAIVGEHDFRAFTPTETLHRSFRREVFRAEFVELEDELVFAIEADALLRHMVRTLVGTMLEVAGGFRTFADFLELIDGAERARAGITAPPHALCLVHVDYAEPQRKSGVKPIF